MAQAKVVDARLVRIWLSSPPGQTTVPASVLICALVTKGFNQTKNMNTAVIPDCDDPTVVAPVKRTPISVDATISGEGYYEPGHRTQLQALFDSSVSTLVYFEISNGEASAGTAGYYFGKFFLTAFNITGDEGQYVRCSMTWEVDGDWNWVAAAFAPIALMAPPEGSPPEEPPPEGSPPEEEASSEAMAEAA